MDNKLNISFDLDGTIISTKTSVLFFRMMSHLLYPEANIFILTSRQPGTEAQIIDELAEMSILYHDIIITDKKAEFIISNDISVVFENEDEQMKKLGREILVLKAKEEGNYNYKKDLWIGSKNTVEMIDE